MPIYEYRCPEGHTFERFQSMTAPAPEKCDVCGAAPLEIVLFPVAIHYKGSGFYSTDYGKGKQKDGGGESKESKPAETKSEKTDSKPAESKPKPASTSSE